jgi:type IV pilus assembly protein PilQ
VTTNVLVDNGSTVVIGGIYNYKEDRLEKGIPFLKNLPLIGWLFKGSYNPSYDKSEMVIFLTPRIINQEQAGLTDAKQ